MAERILILHLYMLSKYPCKINHDLRRQCQDVNKLEMQETNRIYLYQDVEFHPHPQLAALQAASMEMFGDLLVACCSSYHFTVMTQGVYNEPNIILAHTLVILLHKHRHLISIHSLFPRHSFACSFTGYSRRWEDLGMRLLLCEMYASGKR